ncbi:MAG: PulJ/GspJ family protein [Halanaerobiaceae bacterium]
MLKSEDAFTFLEVMLSLVLLAIVFTMLSSSFMNGIGVIQHNQRKTETLNQVQSNLNNSILSTTGNTENVTLVFKENEDDEGIDFSIDALLISERDTYTFKSSSRDIKLEYYEVVMP